MLTRSINAESVLAARNFDMSSIGKTKRHLRSILAGGGVFDRFALHLSPVELLCVERLPCRLVVRGDEMDRREDQRAHRKRHDCQCRTDQRSENPFARAFPHQAPAEESRICRVLGLLSHDWKIPESPSKWA